MSKLDKLIEELCPDGVVFVPLGEVLKNNNASESVSKKDYKDFGRIPVIDQSQAYVAAYTDNESAIPPILPCIIFGDHTRVVKYVNKKFAQGDSGTKVFIPAYADNNTKYIYYAFCNLVIPSRGYNRHWSVVKDIKIPLPPLPLQREIVRILDSFTELSTELTAVLAAEVTSRKRQYEYYRDSLLTFGDEVERQELRCYCDIGDGLHGTPSYSDNGEYYFINGNNLANGHIVFDDKTKKVSIKEYERLKINFSKNTILMSINGTIGNIAFYVGEKVILGKSAAYFSITSDKLDCRFLYYFLQATTTKGYFQKNLTGSTIKNLGLKTIREFKIPVPPIEEQKRIVSILDHFDNLCNDISAGLPAEIEARKKQYEYYRDKLLTFPEAKA